MDSSTDTEEQESIHDTSADTVILDDDKDEFGIKIPREAPVENSWV